MIKQFFVSLIAMGAGLLPAQEISPVLFGQNHWLGQGDEGRTGYLHLLWPAVEESGIQLIRIGGNAYNVAPPSLNRWIAMVDSVQAIGAEPLLQVPHSFTAEQTAELVRTFNGSDRKPIRYWSIGNEPMLHDHFSIEQAHVYLLRIATALRSSDPSIKILVSDEAWMRKEAYEALCGGSLDLTGKDAAGRWLIDGFSFHSYPNGETYTRQDVVETGVQKIRSDVQALTALMEQADQQHGRTGEARLSWALTEVNVTYANPDRDVEGIGNPSFVAGQFMAEIYGIGMEFGALTVAPWCINEPDAVRTDFGYLGLPPDFAPRSSYYHTQMLTPHFKGRFMRTVSSDPLINFVGARDAQEIALLVLNQDSQNAREFELAMRVGTSAFQADAGLDVRQTVSIPAQTSQLYLFDSTGRLLKRVTYGIKENLRNRPPQTEWF